MKNSLSDSTSTIKGITFKIAKGMLAIFSIKLLFVLGIFIQSCSSDSVTSEKNVESTRDFQESLEESRRMLASIPIGLVPINRKNVQKSVAPQTGDFQRETYYLSDTADGEVQNPVRELELNEVETLEEIFILKNNYDLELLNEVRNDDYLAAYELPVEPIMAALEPTVQASKEFFYARGFTESDIIEMLDGEDEAALIPIVMEVTRSINSNDYTSSTLDIMQIFGSSAYAASSAGDVRSCFLETTGISAGIALVGALTAKVIEKTLVRKLVKEAVKKIGGRALGGIGLALMVIDFSLCMGGAYE